MCGDLPAQPTLPASTPTEARVMSSSSQPSRGFCLCWTRRPASRSGLSRSARCGKAQPRASSYRRHNRSRTHLPALVPQRLSVEDAFGLMWNRTACREELARSRNDGLYTPDRRARCFRAACRPRNPGSAKRSAGTQDPSPRLMTSAPRRWHGRPQSRHEPAGPTTSARIRSARRDPEPSRGAPSRAHYLQLTSQRRRCPVPPRVPR
jgi:hypothetical protein